MIARIIVLKIGQHYISELNYERTEKYTYRFFFAILGAIYKDGEIMW